MSDYQYFYDWMINRKGLKDSVAKTNIARIKRIGAVYNLYYEYATDGCKYVLSLFDYSKEEAELGLLPDHDIVIDGNYLTGTQSLRYALRLYIESQNDDVYFGNWLSAPTKAEIPDTDEGLFETDDIFDDMLDSYNEAVPFKDADIGETPKELQDEPGTDSDDSSILPDSGSAVIFKGNMQAFLRYVGPFCKNYVNSITKSARKKHNGICEYCGKKAVLDSAHKDGEDRPIIIAKILESDYKIAEDYYEVDVLKFEKTFKASHLPVEDHIFFLCKDCHTEYDNGTKITTADILAKRVE